MKVIGIVGTKNTGKTTLLTKIVCELVERGFHVGTVKHIYHGFDLEGKDTWKHGEAGAEIVVGAGDQTFFRINKIIGLDKLLEMLECIKKLDFVVLEGFKHSKYAKISTSDYEDDFTLKKVNVTEIDQTAIKSIVDLIEERSFGKLTNLNCTKCGFETCLELAKARVRGATTTENKCFTKSDDVTLKIDNSLIPMNPFVQSIVKNTFLGMVDSLKTPEVGDIKGKKIELLIRDDNN